MSVTKRAFSTTSTITRVASSASSVQLLAANGSRQQALFFNESSAVLYLKFGTTASVTDYTLQIAAGAFWEMPSGTLYRGRIDGIWASANGFLQITESV